MNTSFLRILKFGVKGGVMAAVINLVIFEIALRGFGLDFSVMMGGVPSNVAEVQVIFSSLMPSFIASVLYFILVKKTQNPDKIFRVMATAFLVASFYGPFVWASVLADKLVLGLMHVVAAFEITKSLTRDSKKSLLA